MTTINQPDPEQLPMDGGESVEKSETGAAPKRAYTRRTRETPREATRSGEVIGRGGEVLSRKRTGVGDIFAIPAELVPKGWSYQWCAISVVGNTEVLLDQNLMMAENGWRPVPASRYPGRFMPVGHGDKPIVRGGQMLMERPEELTKQAQKEDERNARQLMSDRNESLKLSAVKGNLPAGFEMSQQRRGTGGSIRMSIDPALDIPAPSHPLAEPGE